MKRLPFIVMLTVILALAAILMLAAYSSKSPDALTAGEGEFIKWVDFNVPQKALSDALLLDTSTYGTDKHITLVEALSFVAAKHYGEYKGYKSAFLTTLSDSSDNWRESMKENKLYKYYSGAYMAAVGGLVGEYTCVTVGSDGSVTESEEYGLRAFSPIAEGFYYNDYDDFGAARSYGYKRSHLGHDMLGSIGTPIIAVESGKVEACGWNQYGGWRIGIRSFDGLRYYYYAHLRKDHPYCDMYEGKIVNAGEVIGYLGMTGYSAKENVNNIDVPHLHFGLELIFDETQKDGYNQIWIDVYALTKFLYRNRSSVQFNSETKEYSAKTYYVYSETPD